MFNAWLSPPTTHPLCACGGVAFTISVSGRRVGVTPAFSEAEAEREARGGAAAATAFSLGVGIAATRGGWDAKRH